jgi:hypothetical protein
MPTTVPDRQAGYAARFLADSWSGPTLSWAAAWALTVVDEPQLIGDRIGVTVFPGGKERRLLVINVGDQQVMLVTWQDDHEVVWCWLAAEVAPVTAVRQDLEAELTDGFGRGVANYGLVFPSFEAAGAILDDDVAVAGMRALVGGKSHRSLFKPTWNNPHAARLLIDAVDIHRALVPGS